MNTKKILTKVIFEIKNLNKKNKFLKEEDKTKKEDDTDLINKMFKNKELYNPTRVNIGKVSKLIIKGDDNEPIYGLKRKIDKRVYLFKIDNENNVKYLEMNWDTFKNKVQTVINGKWGTLTSSSKNGGMIDKDETVLTSSNDMSLDYDEDVRSLPENLEFKFRNIQGVDFDKFKNEVESIGLPLKTAIRQLYIESGFKEDVIKCGRKSSAGAMGIAQFMPGTWPSYGNGSPCNVKDALPAYVKLMSKLLDMFPGRIDLVLAGYNWGPYRQILKNAKNNNIPFKDLKEKMPKETYRYVTSILQ